MQITFVSAVPAAAPVVALPVAKDAVAAATATPLGAAAARDARFEGGAGELAEYLDGGHDAVTRRIMVGIGDGAAADLEKAASAIVARLLTSGTTSLVIDATALSAEQVVALARGAGLRAWRYDNYRTRLPEKQKPTLTDVTIATPHAMDAAWDAEQAVLRGVALARALVTEPGNIIYPESFVERVRDIASLGVDVQVLDEKAMAAAGMGALLGVGQGSARPPRLLVMRWNGAADAGAKPVALIGKGVTFDTGGISLKPGAGMEDMKWDMGGAAAVAGAMHALAARKARANVVGVCALAENMPDGLAQRPGDVVTSMSGQTIEVINTDAEGRLVLCDAFTWVQKNVGPSTIVDLATLTGAMIISLGHEHGGIFSNDDGLADQLLAAGRATGEKLWRFPLLPEYDKLIDSPIADMKNVGPREAGSITAAQFLQRFVDDGVRWAHLDIAGMVWAAKSGTLHDKGATGFGVRLLDRWIADTVEG